MRFLSDYTLAEIGTLPAGAELYALVAQAEAFLAGATDLSCKVLDDGRCFVSFTDAEGTYHGCRLTDYSDWRDTGRLLDAAVARGQEPELWYNGEWWGAVCYTSGNEEYEGRHETSGPTAFARAFAMAARAEQSDV